MSTSRIDSETGSVRPSDSSVSSQSLTSSGASNIGQPSDRPEPRTTLEEQTINLIQITNPTGPAQAAAGDFRQAHSSQPKRQKKTKNGKKYCHRCSYQGHTSAECTVDETTALLRKEKSSSAKSKTQASSSSGSAQHKNRQNGKGKGKKQQSSVTATAATTIKELDTNLEGANDTIGDLSRENEELRAMVEGLPDVTSDAVVIQIAPQSLQSIEDVNPIASCSLIKMFDRANSPLDPELVARILEKFQLYTWLCLALIIGVLHYSLSANVLNWGGDVLYMICLLLLTYLSTLLLFFKARRWLRAFVIEILQLEYPNMKYAGAVLSAEKSYISLDVDTRVLSHTQSKSTLQAELFNLRFSLRSTRSLPVRVMEFLAGEVHHETITMVVSGGLIKHHLVDVDMMDDPKTLLLKSQTKISRTNAFDIRAEDIARNGDVYGRSAMVASLLNWKEVCLKKRIYPDFVSPPLA